MSPLPGIPSQPKPPMPAPKKKTSIRTVPKPAQKQFLDRLKKLRTEPLAVLPTCVGTEPKIIAKARQRLTKMEGSKPGFMDKRDKQIVGAVAQAWSVADWKEAPRMLDAKVGGQRKFYVQRGHVERAINLGIQNYDHAPSLLMAYRSMAKSDNLHFFAQPQLWCTGNRPAPPEEWIAALAERASITLESVDDGWACGHDAAQVVLGFRDGPSIRVCGRCGKKGGQFHRILASRYAGPRQRQPLRVQIRAPDGQLLKPEAEPVAKYRAGIHSEEDLIKDTLAGWSPEGTVWMLGGNIHRNLESWLDELGAQPWERTALAAMAPDGFDKDAQSVSQVLEALSHRLDDGVKAVLPDTTGAWLGSHRQMAIRDILRAADHEATRREATANMPAQAWGPIGTFLDAMARTNKADGRTATIASLRKAADEGSIPALHLWLALQGIGGDTSLAARIGDHTEDGGPLIPLAQAVFTSEGEAYTAALADYLRQTGTGEA